MTQTNIEVTKEDEPDDFKALTPPAVDEAKEKQDAEAAAAKKAEEEANLGSEQVDYKEKFSASAQEAIRLTKENDTKTSELAFKDKMIEVAKDQEQIHEIAKHNPSMADAICKEFGWGNTYSEATASKDGDDEDSTKVAVDPVIAANKVFDQREEAKEKQSISDYEVQFFIDNKIAIGSQKFKTIMKTYNKYSPKTLSDSQQLFKMAHKEHLPEEEVDIPAPNGDLGGGSKTKDAEFTDDDKKMMKEREWDAEKMRKFKASKLY